MFSSATFIVDVNGLTFSMPGELKFLAWAQGSKHIKQMTRNMTYVVGIKWDIFKDIVK